MVRWCPQARRSGERVVLRHRSLCASLDTLTFVLHSFYPGARWRHYVTRRARFVYVEFFYIIKMVVGEYERDD